MTAGQVTIAALGCIDGALLVISYLIYNRIRALSGEFDLLIGNP